MQRKKVKSSDLSSVGYDKQSKILEVEFSTGDIYQYSSVPEDTYLGLMSAISHGKYFNQYIKGEFSYQKI